MPARAPAIFGRPGKTGVDEKFTVATGEDGDVAPGTHQDAYIATKSLYRNRGTRRLFSRLLYETGADTASGRAKILREATKVAAPANPVNARKRRREMFEPKLLVMGFLFFARDLFKLPTDRQTAC